MSRVLKEIKSASIIEYDIWDMLCMFSDVVSALQIAELKSASEHSPNSNDERQYFYSVELLENGNQYSYKDQSWMD